MGLLSNTKNDLPRRRQQSTSDSQPRRVYSDDQQQFRRNRTLTGSASSYVRGAANESTSHLKSSRVHAHELHEHRRRISGILVVVVACVIFLSILLWQFTASVTFSVENVSSRVATESYDKIIQTYYAERPFERFRFAVNDSTLTAYVQQHAPEVAFMRVDGAAGFTNALVRLEMRRPIAGWKINSTQYYVDAKGVSFTKNYYSSPAVQIVDESGVQLEAGRAIASNRFLGYVGRTVALTNAQNMTAEQVVIPAGTTRQIELRLKEVAYPVRILIDRPVGEQVEDMVRAVRYFQAKNQTPEYLDVRVSGKAFYR